MKLILFWIFMIPLALNAQVKDDFTDGDFTTDPSWTGDTASFTVNSKHQLQLNSSGTATSCLVTRMNIGSSMEWEFWIKLSFNTSLNNFARIYLCSDSPEIKQDVNAIYLQTGGQGDSLNLFRQKGNNHLLLFRFPSLRTNSSVNVFRIKICMDSTGHWELYADSTGGRKYLRYGGFIEKQTLPSGWFGVFCRYTSSNSKNICFDDLYAGRIRYDTNPPRVISAGFSDSLTIRIKFSEPIDSSCLQKWNCFTLKSNPEKVWKYYILQSTDDEVFVQINNDENAFFCDTLNIKKVSDYSGNFIVDTCIYLCYYIPGNCDVSDIVINEVLFHPDALGSRFIEFYNRSSKSLDLNTVVACTAGAGESPSHAVKLSQDEKMLLPKEFFVLAADSAKLCSRYFVPDRGKLSSVGEFPAMDSDSGSVFLILEKDSMIIDNMFYSERMQLPFLLKTDGVSLERLSPDVPSGCRSNWQSASESSGYASPGAENSHYAVNLAASTDIQISSPVISPDNDGKDDLLFIKVNKVEAGTLLSLRVFDLRGNLVKTITSPVVVSEEALFLWDGTSDDNAIAAMGYYIIMAESINVSGRHSRVKKPVVVVQKF